MQILEQHTCTQLLLEPEVRCLTAHHNTGRSRFPVLSRSNSLESVWLKLPLHQSVAKSRRSGSKQKQTKENRVDWLRWNVQCVWGFRLCVMLSAVKNTWTVSGLFLSLVFQFNQTGVFMTVIIQDMWQYLAHEQRWMHLSCFMWVMKHNGPLLLDLCMTDIQMNVIMLNKGAKQLLCKLC